MERLIVTTHLSSAGCIKAARLADHVIGLEQRLIPGPLPTEAATRAFYGESPPANDQPERFSHWRMGLAARDTAAASGGFIETCRRYQHVSFWIDPDPNSWLILLQVLDVLAPFRDILASVSLAFPEQAVGALSPAAVAAGPPAARALTLDQQRLASRAWRAYQEPAPQAWFGLLQDDTSDLPGLRASVLRVLAELPGSGNGLAASEARLLALAGAEGANFGSVFAAYMQSDPPPALDYWQAGRCIAALASCAAPLILGVDETDFSPALHDDPVRFAAYRARLWSLSQLGERIRDGHEDFSRHVAIDRWVGNTHLTPDRLWRWDQAGQRLLPGDRSSKRCFSG